MGNSTLISVVDDDDCVRESLHRLIRSAGFAVQVFASAEEFLNSDHLRNTHCLILDVRMPRMNGTELQRQLMASHQEIPIVFITAHGDKAAHSQALKNGAVDYLLKPFSEELLLNAIATALAREDAPKKRIETRDKEINDRATLVQDFTTSGDQVLSQLMFVNPKGSTALYDAAYLAVEKIQQGRQPKKALLIISDGQDNNSRYTYKELRNRVKESDAIIYAIGITDPANDSLAGFGRGLLEEMSRMTGGRAFFPNAYNEPELVEICTRIALELRHQYSIGFYPTDIATPARWHKVQVKVNPPRGLGRLSLSYKDGYQSFAK